MTEEAVLELIRAVRHSALNHLQVIGGWLQLGHVERAQEYIAQVTERFAAESSLARLPCMPLALALLAATVRAELYAVNVHWQAEALDGCSVDSESCELARSVLLAAVDELGGARGSDAPLLRVSVQGEGDGVCLHLESSVPLHLGAAPDLPWAAASLGAHLEGLGSRSVALRIPATSGTPAPGV